MVINRIALETATKYKSDVLTKQNEKVMEQAKKDLKVETEQENLDKRIDEEIEGKQSPTGSYTSSQAPTVGSQTDINIPPPSQKHKSKFDFGQYTKEGLSRVQKLQFLHDLLTKEGNYENKEYDYKLSVGGPNKIILKKGLDNSEAGITQYDIKDKGNGKMSELDIIINRFMSDKPMAGKGIKSKRSKKPTKNDIEHYKSRFLILKGQVLAGNDNPVVVSELKHVIKILEANKLLNKN